MNPVVHVPFNAYRFWSSSLDAVPAKCQDGRCQERLQGSKSFSSHILFALTLTSQQQY